MGLHLVVIDRIDFFIHQRFDFVRPGIADDDQAHIVADECRQFLVLQDGRGRLEDRGFVWIVDMGFDFVARFRAQVAHQRIKHAEHVEIIALLRHLVAQGFAKRLAGILDDLQWIGNDEAADSRPPMISSSSNGWIRTPIWPPAAMIAAENAAKDNNQSDNHVHWASPVRFVVIASLYIW